MRRSREEREGEDRWGEKNGRRSGWQGEETENEGGRNQMRVRTPNVRTLT